MREDGGRFAFTILVHGLTDMRIDMCMDMCRGHARMSVHMDMCASMRAGTHVHKHVCTHIYCWRSSLKGSGLHRSRPTHDDGGHFALAVLVHGLSYGPM